MPQDLTDDKSTLDQVMAWCHQAPSHYLSQCWPRYMSPYGVNRPQWVNITMRISQILIVRSNHYNDGTWTLRHLKSVATSLHIQHFTGKLTTYSTVFQVNYRVHFKDSHPWPFVWGSFPLRWPVMMEVFHVIMSSCMSIPYMFRHYQTVRWIVMGHTVHT